MVSEPLPCLALRFGNFVRCHVARQFIAIDLGPPYAPQGGKIEPFMGFDQILVDALAGGITQAEVVKCLGSARFSVT